MNPLFAVYENAFNEIKEVMQDELPRTLRIFNIRIRLALDININFNGELSLTKTPEVKATYIKIFKMLEKWNSYEAFTHYANSIDGYTKQKESPYKAYLKVINDNSGCTNILIQKSNELKVKYKLDSRFKTSIDEYFSRIETDINIKEGLKDNCRTLYLYIRGDSSITGHEILGLIYAERNMYYHNGETAKMGMNYSDRGRLIDILSETIEDYILKIAAYILSKEKEKSI